MDIGSARLVVIILTFSQREKTMKCLSTLLGSGDKHFQVLVWDNGSRDNTLAAVKETFPEVLTHYSESNLGVAGGRNAAAEMAITKYGAAQLLFLDNDILVDPGFVCALYEPFKAEPLLGQTQAKLRFMHDRSLINDGGGARISFVFWRVKPVGFGEPDRGQYDAPRPCISCGGAMMVRSDVFQQLNGFDPWFGPFGPEDLDFSLRLQKAGYKAMYIPKAVGYHQVSHTYGEGYSEEYARHKSRHWLLFMRRHANIWQKIGFYLFGAPILAVKVFIREARRGNLRAVRGLIEGILQPKRRVE
ncbi:MAG TPA: glycosyltransferase family 2 protein [Anaerolineales bacterium]|nr:glycosyltransferase family 2 protein [Anaerolineales bacterium]